MERSSRPYFRDKSFKGLDKSLNIIHLGNIQCLFNLVSVDNSLYSINESKQNGSHDFPPEVMRITRILSTLVATSSRLLESSDISCSAANTHLQQQRLFLYFSSNIFSMSHFEEHQIPMEDTSHHDDGEDSEDSEEDEDSAEVEEGIRKLKFKLLDNPFDYNTHLELISFARNHAELQEVRAARQEMSKRFPLTSALWLEWINDENTILSGQPSDEGKAFVTELFERSVKDYASVDLWLEYAQHTMTDMGTPDGIERVRQVTNRGLIQVGLDCAKGSLLWDFLREFEKILFSLSASQEDKVSQATKLLDVYRRQLSVPLLNMESTFAEFEEWIEDVKDLVNPEDIAQVKTGYQKAIKTLELITPFENAIVSSKDGPHTEKFKEYALFAQQHLTPAVVQSIFERGITENPLDPDLWITYTKYLDDVVKIKELSRDVYERGVRNCPWSGSLWSNFIQSLEGFEYELSDIILVFERSLSAGLASGSDFKLVWTTYLDCQRRKTNFSSSDEVERLRKSFNSASEYLAGIPDADPSFSILQYSARVEAVFCKSMSNAREIWNNMMQIKELKCQACLWLEYFHLEYAHGDRKEARKILLKAFTPSLDWPESVGELLLRMEREEGDCLDIYNKMLVKYNQVMTKVAEKRQKEESKQPTSTHDLKDRTSNQTLQSRKRKADKSSDETTTFKKPHLPQNDSAKKINKTNIEPKKEAEATLETEKLPHFVKPKDKTEADDLLTVFVSNLDFKVDEDKLRQVFSEFGSISDIRLVKNYKGLSKGFGYIQYSSMEGVRKALSNDRLKIDGRPAFVSEVGKKKAFQFKDTLEKNKLFVNGLSPEVDEQTLRNIFEKYGQLRDIRIVTYRNGHSKGCAYIDFDDEVSARAGLAADGLLLKEKNIRVAISDPKKKKEASVTQVLGSAVSGPGTAGTSRGTTGRQRISVPMVPSVLRRQTVITKPQNNSTGNGIH